jgi:hypothetical protein
MMPLAGAGSLLLVFVREPDQLGVERPHQTVKHSGKSSTSPPPVNRFEASHTAACPVPAWLSGINCPRTVCWRAASGTASCTTSRTCQEHHAAHARCECSDTPCDRSCSPARSRRR